MHLMRVKKQKTLFIKITSESTGSQLFSLAQSVGSLQCTLYPIMRIYIEIRRRENKNTSYECL